MITVSSPDMVWSTHILCMNVCKKVYEIVKRIASLKWCTPIFEETMYLLLFSYKYLYSLYTENNSKSIHIQYKNGMNEKYNKT